MNEQTVEYEKVSALAGQIMRLSHDDILMHLRFFDIALMKLSLREQKGMGAIATDGRTIYYDPYYVIKQYADGEKRVTRIFLHTVLHCIFSHNFGYDKLEKDLWDIATDIAVESVIYDMKLPSVTLEEDMEFAGKLRVLKEDCGGLTAEKLYRYFRNNPITEAENARLQKLFCKDNHYLWRSPEEIEITMEDWKKISERIKADLKTFSKARAGVETLEKNLEEATRERYDYAEIMKRFTVMGEDITVNDDEFDYVYYTYGLSRYGNMPLIEPLEYREALKVRDFVIAIDTSASCRGSIVRAFLQKTYNILMQSENFFHKINVHIIQCDSEVRSDTKITGKDDFDKFMKYGKLTGFGATDFRPVFQYIETLQNQGEFENLKGLIYFTDGYGIYPERMPDYDVIFAFLDEDEHRAPIPPWSMKVILERETLEDEADEAAKRSEPAGKMSSDR